MQRVKSKLTAPDDWANDLRALLVQKEIRPPGDGWLNSMELAEKLKLSQNQARRILRDGFQAGLLEKFKGTKNDGRRAYCKVWYRKKNQTQVVDC